MSISGVSRACYVALLCSVALPEFARAQSVLVRHSVVAEVAPVVSVRDSVWSAPLEIGGGTQTTWSGEIRANTVSEVQVLGPINPEQPAYARRVGGQWVRLEPGTWHTIVVTPAGRRVVTMEVLLVSPGSPQVRPAVRVVAMGATR